jgi:hypothetical protein
MTFAFPLDDPEFFVRSINYNPILTIMQTSKTRCAHAKVGRMPLKQTMKPRSSRRRSAFAAASAIRH